MKKTTKENIEQPYNMQLETLIKSIDDLEEIPDEKRETLIKHVNSLAEYYEMRLNEQDIVISSLRFEKEELFEESQKSERTDLTRWRSTTGIEMSEYVLHLSAREKLPVWVGVIDVDFLKLINDSHSYSEGDDVLRLVAEATNKGGIEELNIALRELSQDVISSVTESFVDELRNTDMVFEYGVDEFVLLLPGVEEEFLPKIFDRVVTTLEEKVKNSDLISPELAKIISFSAGIVKARIQHEYNDGSIEYESRDYLFKRAAGVLKESKKEGRNTLSIEQSNGKIKSIKLRKNIKDLNQEIEESDEYSGRYS